jgi:hypothetical protein
LTIIPNNTNNTGSLENRKSVLGIKPAKQITREERSLRLFDSIGPAFATPIKGQELLISHATKMVSNTHLIARAHLQRVPRVPPSADTRSTYRLAEV